MLSVLANGRSMNYSPLFFSKRLIVHCILILLVIFASFASGAARLSEDEVKALESIGKTLGKDWNFSVDPCSAAFGWITITKSSDSAENNVTCGNCSTTTTTATGGDDQICHVTSISLKAQDLAGTLPPEFARLPYLQKIDLSRNYLSGPIPPEWGSLLLLVSISLVGNRLNGSIPSELGNISTLQGFDIMCNNFSRIPKEFGNLTSIQRLLLSSNNFTGKLPETFANLTTLKDFRVDDNHFSGKIPDFIQNWKNLEKLVIQASGLTGPIPSNISLLTRLTDLRITDLDGPEAPFPSLTTMTKLKTLMLRNCNLTGELPTYLVELPDLKNLDLSFNKFTGEIPSRFVKDGLDYIFLTGNFLHGSVPESLKVDSFDLSYNNFTSDGTDNCDSGGMNLFASSSKGNKSIISCLSTTCPKASYSFYINCGGDAVNTTTPIKFEADGNRGGPSSFYVSQTNWGFSSTGYYPDDDSTTDTFIASNVSILSMPDPQLYTKARVSPISLTYFGFCMINGNYTVQLHFVEIMFTNTKSYRSLGRRIFDVYIQGKLVEKDFNIAEKAGGAGKLVKKNYTASVKDGTLEIRFFWNGKGTQALPARGVYGPLISAIVVELPGYKPPKLGGGSGISAGAVVVMVAGGVFIILVILATLWCKGFIGNTLEQVENQRKIQDMLNMMNSNRPANAYGLQSHGKGGHDLSVFKYKSIISATCTFSDKNKVGEGGFGPVYKGRLVNGQEVAVKRLSKCSGQGISEFKNELILIYELQHTNLVQLFGFCIHGEERMLVYEYMRNKSLDYYLFDSTRCRKLDWTKRFNIIDGIAQGLVYLHRYSRLRIIHRDLKASNVLLDENMNPKISDFGLARIFAHDEQEANTMKIVGTRGYMPPEYVMGGNFSMKSDVYSFGVLMLEILSGRKNNSFYNDDRAINLVSYAWALWKEGAGLGLMDQTLTSSCNNDQFLRCIHVGLLCVEENAASRPTMLDVIYMLSMMTNESLSLPLPTKPAFCVERNMITAAVCVEIPEMVASVNGISNSDFNGR